MKLVASLLGALAIAPASLPGAKAIPICGAAGPYWPTMTLALNGSSAWVACKEQSRVTRVDTASGRTVKSVRLGGPPIAVVSGYGSIWALDSGATLYRLNPSTGRIVKRVVLPVTAAYNIWIGGGSVWVADDQGGLVVRVAPATSKVVAQPLVGDGPADMAFDGASAWVINHRDRVLSRIDLRTNRSQQVAVLPGENQAPERMVWLKGKLWITGRGADLLRVNPASGAVEKTIEIGASGIDVATDGRNLWVPTRTATVDRSGFPTMTALKRVSGATGAVTTVVRARGRVDVHGLATRNGFVWLADNTNGRLYRLR